MNSHNAEKLKDSTALLVQQWNANLVINLFPCMAPYYQI